MDEDRIRKLARKLDQVADEDARRIKREREIAALRREAAFDLYVICSNFVRVINASATKGRLELAPPDYSPDSFQDDGPNLFQINVSGHIVQISFQTTGPLLSTEEFRTPYAIEGAVRWFNQQTLESLGMEEQQLFLCVEKGSVTWTCFDPQTHRTTVLDEDYLAKVMEQVLT